MNYIDYLQEASNVESDSGSWEDVSDFLEESNRRERNRVEKQIEEIDEELEKLEEVRDKNVGGLEEKIRRQSQRLDIAERSAEPDEEIVRNRLEDLYRELRSERRSTWESRQSLLRERRELERELRELEDIDLLEDVR